MVVLTYNVTQSGTNDAVVDADFSGDEHDVDITPRVTKHAIPNSAISFSSPFFPHANIGEVSEIL